MDPLTMSLILGGAGVATNIIRGSKQASQAKKLEAEFEAKDKALQPVSPEQYAYLNRVRQMQRSMAMGTDPTSAMAQRGLSQSLAQTQGNIARLGTGASTVSGLLRAQQGYNLGMGQVAGQAFDQSRAYMQQEQGLIDNIQKSIYGLQMKRRNYAQQKAVAMRQDASDSATAAIAGLGQMATMIPNKVGGDVDMDWMGKTAAQKSAVITDQINASLPSDRLMSDAPMYKNFFPSDYTLGSISAAKTGANKRNYGGFRFNESNQIEAVPLRKKDTLGIGLDFVAPEPFGGF